MHTTSLTTCPCSGICGDGTVGVGEECDDGNMASGDGCSAVCKNEGFMLRHNSCHTCHPLAQSILVRTTSHCCSSCHNAMLLCCEPNRSYLDVNAEVDSVCDGSSGVGAFNSSSMYWFKLRWHLGIKGSWLSIGSFQFSGE